MGDKIKILVAAHKADPNIRQDDVYMPIHVGKALHPEVDLGFQGDDTGDNISEKNGSYCELTALYWAWKNLKDVDIIGLAHYRRYFAFGGIKCGGYYFQNVKDTIQGAGTLDVPKNINDIFLNKDIIMAKSMVYPIPLDIHYSIAHDKKDLKALREVVEELYPEYIQAFDKVMGGNKISLCNMFIMRRESFEEYSKWLFDILFELEKRIEIPKDSYQSRIFGFMSERLLNIYVSKNKMRVKYLPLVKISDEAPVKPIKGHIKNLLGDISYKIIKKSSEINIRY